MIVGAQRHMLICMILHWLLWFPKCAASHGDLCFRGTVHWLSRLGVQCGKKKTTNRPQPQPSHRRGSFHRRLQPLYTEKHKVSCSGFLSATLPMQHSCSHSNAICNHSFKKRIELRRQKHTQSSFKAQLQCGKKKRQTDRSRNRRTDEVAFIAGCSHFTRKNARFRAPASSPQHSPCNIHAAIPMQSATRDSRTA